MHVLLLLRYILHFISTVSCDRRVSHNTKEAEVSRTLPGMSINQPHSMKKRFSIRMAHSRERRKKSSSPNARMLPENKNGFSVSSSVAFSFSWWIKTFFPAPALCTAAERFTSTKHKKHPDLDHEIESTLKLKWKYFCWTRRNCYYWVCVCARFSLEGFVGIEIRHLLPSSVHRSLPTIIIISFVDRNACAELCSVCTKTHRAVSNKRQKSGDLSGINFHFSLNSYLP